MTTSELIARLQTSLVRNGDQPVAVDAGDGVFALQDGKGLLARVEEFEEQLVVVLDLTTWEDVDATVPQGWDHV